ncbi:hypothetical protein ANCCEY_14835, partial [Ancylostoma ceylanicum]
KKRWKRRKDKTQRKEVTVAGLPPGWKVLDESRREIPGTNGGHMITRTLVFSPIPGSSRARRQSGRGVGSVVAIEDVGTDKPPMPMSMLLNGGKVEAIHTSLSHLHTCFHLFQKSSTSANHPKGKPFSTQQVSSTLGIKGKSNERIVGVGTGSRDLHSRTPTISSAKGLKPGSVGGSRSDVNWKGKTISVNGRTVAAGPGTFTFGSSPTGAFLKKEN